MVEPTDLNNEPDNVCLDVVFDDVPPPPSSPPLFFRQNATWDEESRIREEIRVREVIKAMKEKKLKQKL